MVGWSGVRECTVVGLLGVEVGGALPCDRLPNTAFLTIARF